MGVEAAGTSMCLESGNPSLSKTSRMRGSPVAAEWTSCLEYMEENKAFCPRGSSAPEGPRQQCEVFKNASAPLGRAKCISSVWLLQAKVTKKDQHINKLHKQPLMCWVWCSSRTQAELNGMYSCEWEVFRLWMAGTACPVHCTFYSHSGGCRNPEVNTINKAKACPFHPKFPTFSFVLCTTITTPSHTPLQIKYY